MADLLGFAKLPWGLFQEETKSVSQAPVLPLEPKPVIAPPICVAMAIGVVTFGVLLSKLHWDFLGAGSPSNIDDTVS